MLTPHNAAKEGEIAKTVLLFGDGTQAHHLAHKFLSNVRKVSDIRYACFFTGEYKGKTYTFGTSGMGFGSAGIYIYELYEFFKVERIIRVGSCGGYAEDLRTLDTVIVKDAYCDHSYFSENIFGRKDMQVLKPTEKTHNKLLESIKKLNYKVPEVRSHASAVYYYSDPEEWKEFAKRMDAQVVEMESYTLFLYAALLNKEAACLVTISAMMWDLSTEATWDQWTDMRIPSVEVILNAGLED